MYYSRDPKFHGNIIIPVTLSFTGKTKKIKVVFFFLRRTEEFLFLVFTYEELWRGPQIDLF